MPVFEFGEDWTSKTPSPKDLSGLVNSYDNGLLYNVDSFFKNLADDYSRLPNNTIIFYTSDHGEAFNTDGRSPHGGSSVEEATVPLFAFGLPVENIDISFKASHANLFTALLDLMNVPMDARKYPYAKSLLTATASDSQRRFFNLADGKKVAFDP